VIQEINEPVAVIALYDKGVIRPYRVKWRNRVYHVTNLVSHWKEKVGGEWHIHLSVETKEATMELVIDPSDVSWRLARVNLEG
jgi:hypothetical protein